MQSYPRETPPCWRIPACPTWWPQAIYYTDAEKKPGLEARALATKPTGKFAYKEELFINIL